MSRINRILLGLICGTILFGCGKYKLEEENHTQEEENEGSEDHNGNKELDLKLKIVSHESGALPYPLSVFLFNGKQNCIHQQELTDSQKQYSTTVTKGVYHFSVFSGLKENDCIFPTPLSSTQFIRLSPKNYGVQSLEFGQASISLRQSTQVDVTLSPAVAAVNFHLKEVPPAAEKVEIILSPISSGLSFKGSYSNDNQSCSITCHQQGDLWQSNTLYVLPQESSSTHISIKVQLPGKDEVYSYTYHATLKPGYPYQFSGTFDKGIALNGDFQIEGWQPAVDVEFGFDEIKPDTGDGEGGNEGGGNEGETGSDMDCFFVAQLPEEDAIWGYFYIWKLIPLSEKSAQATIVAPDQWYTLREDGMKLLHDYQVDEIRNWRVFSTEEAQKFRDQFRSQIDDLNYFFKQNGLDIFYYSEGGRYLCNNGQSTFSFVNNRITNAGKTVKYYLRPVKTILLKVK